MADNESKKMVDARSNPPPANLNAEMWGALTFLDPSFLEFKPGSAPSNDENQNALR
jgi:hypothetical protein